MEKAKIAAEEEEKRREAAEVAALKDKLHWLGHKKTHKPKIDDEDFPSLGAKPALKAPKMTVGKSKKGVRVKMNKFVISAKSYREERRDQRKKSTDDTEQRTVAFEVLADKDGLEKKLTKTRMCNSVGKGKCQHGDKCRFAHSLDELKISTCFFGDKCRFVKVVEGKLFNKGQKRCDHKHPNESNDEFLLRTGLDRYKSVVEKPVVVVEPKVIELPKYSAAHLEKMEAERKAKAKRTEEEMKLPGAWAAKFKPTSVSPVRPDPVKPSPLIALEAEETVLRVPKELVMQALELAIKNGKRHIRIEIV
jgi:hypothetical protein